MRLSWLFFFAVILSAAEDPREIVRRAVDLDHRNVQIARNYTYIERQEERKVDGSGKVTERKSKTFDVTPVADGAPYRRLVARDDKPLSPDEQKAEQQKLEASMAETPEQRSKRIAEWDRKQQRLRDALREIVDAFDLTLAGEERIGGREVYVIDATPRPKYHPRTQIGKLFPKTKGRLWIDKADYSWVKAEAELIDTISYGLFVARLQKGTRFTAEQTRVNEEVWLPRYVFASASGRIALLKRFGGVWEITFRDYRRFQADSRLVPAEAGATPAP